LPVDTAFDIRIRDAVWQVFRSLDCASSHRNILQVYVTRSTGVEYGGRSTIETVYVQALVLPTVRLEIK